MVVVLGMAAFGIEVATWYAKHHQTQVVADSAALAASNCLAHPGVGSGTMNVNGTSISVPACSNSSDTTDATTVAVDYAAANGVSINASQVQIDTTNDKVTVNASASEPTTFARVFGVNNATQSAAAAASWKGAAGAPCGTPGKNCDFMFANSNACPGPTALTLSLQGNSGIEGNIQTNGSLNASDTGNAGGVDGAGIYGPGACTNTTGGNHNPWKTSAPSQEPATITWPIDYSQDFPACGGSGQPACIQSGYLQGYPTFCTNVSTNKVMPFDNSIPADTPVPGQVYCAVGPDGVRSNPATWDGTITIAASGNNTFSDTFVGGTISYTGAGSDTITPCGYTASGYSSSSCSAPAPATSNYPVFYAVGTDPNGPSCTMGTNPSSTCAFSISSNGNLTLDGDVFVQNGTANLNFQGNQSAGNTMFEANVINATLNGNFNGDGPTATGGSGSGTSGGIVSLTQ
jgi:hypothetical protein